MLYSQQTPLLRFLSDIWSRYRITRVRNVILLLVDPMITKVRVRSQITNIRGQEFFDGAYQNFSYPSWLNDIYAGPLLQWFIEKYLIVDMGTASCTASSKFILFLKILPNSFGGRSKVWGAQLPMVTLWLWTRRSLIPSRRNLREGNVQLHGSMMSDRFTFHSFRAIHNFKRLSKF